ncbi:MULTISPECIES: DUF3037 domain-containing protein [unclassified Variovorax]|uniref:DUF3037 domain-containing protein n=1 Tax=unclassified Variovorax TaxID=663243 RepID=UPI003F464862
MNTTARTPYSYVVLRYVHDIGTGEFINVGVVLMAARGSYVGAKFKTAYGRVKKAFPSVDPDVFRARMKRLQTTFDHIAEGDFSAVRVVDQEGVGRIEQLVHSVIRADDSSLQWSPVGSGLSKDLPMTLLALFQRFVTKYDTDLTNVPRKDDDVWKHFRTELEKRNVLSHLEEKVIAVADDAVKFEHAWKNGAWHCYEPLSFDLSSDASIKEKAHRWLGQVSSIKDAREDFHVYFLVGKPTDAALNDAYEKAVSILRKAPVSEVVEEESAEEFSKTVANAISKHEIRPL